MFYRIFFRSDFPAVHKTTSLHPGKQVCCLLLVVCFIVNQAFSQPHLNDEMQDLGAFAEEHALDIDFWEVTMKEQIDREQANRFIQELKKQDTLYADENADRIKYTFESSHIQDSFNVRYNVILPSDNNNPAEMIIVLRGEDWNKQMSQKYGEAKKTIQKNYLTKRSQVYTCLSVQGSAIINHDVFINIAEQYFNINNISTRDDNIENARIKKSTYGYIKTWEQFYFMENDPKNVHIAAVADSQGKKRFMIGTPILIHEY